MYRQNKNRPGFLLVEMATAIFVVALILSVLAVSLNGYASFNDYLLARQRCTAAAQAQLDSIAATGSPISDKDMQRLWPDVRISIENSQGRGQWQSLKLLKVSAEAKTRRKTVHLQLSRYFLAGQER